jgi:adenylate cyclase
MKPNTEIERKFLVNHDLFKGVTDQLKGKSITQAYMCDSTRIRLIDYDAWITIKSKPALVRSEFEYPIPWVDAVMILNDTSIVKSVVKKSRYKVEHKGHTWEVDVFDDNVLIVAEIELTTKDEKFELPEWLGDEVTEDPHFYNCNM